MIFPFIELACEIDISSPAEPDYPPRLAIRS